MARILLSALPFTGHVTPLLAVTEALVARGHAVRFYTGSAFRERVEAAGATLVPWRIAPDFDENDLAATFPRLVGKKGFSQLLINVADCFIGTAAAQYRDLEAEWEREPWDITAGDEVSIGVVLFATKRRLRWATTSIIPLNLPGPAGPPSGIGLTPGTNAVMKTRDAALRALVPLISRPLLKPMEDAFAEVGLDNGRRTMDQVVFSPHLIVASGSPLLDYDRPDRPAHLHFVGQLARPAAAPAALPDWWGDLDGRTVVHVTQGTQNIDPSDLLRPALEALADRDVLVVAATGVRGRDTLPFPVPPNVRVAGFLPYDALLPRTDVVITNGGWGGTLAALSHGIPLIIAGGDLDKPEIASRVGWTGAGINLKTGTPSAAKVAAAYDRIASERSFRDAAASVAAQLNALGGAPRAAELIEQLA